MKPDATTTATTMYDVRQFKPALYLLVMLGVSGFALAAEAPGVWLLAMAAVAVNAWLDRTGRFRPIPRWLSNVITIAAFTYVFVQITQFGPHAAITIGQFLVLLQVVKLYEQRANRDFAQVLLLSFLLMVAATINTASLLFFVVLLAYLLVLLYAFLLFQLKVETDAARRSTDLVDAKLNAGALRRDEAVLARSMRRLTAVISVGGVAAAVVVFLVFPRGSGGGFAPLQFRQGQTLTGFSEQVSFQQVARITQNNDVVAHVKLFRVRPDGTEQLVRGGRPLLLRGVTLDIYNGDAASGARWQWTRDIHSDRTPEFARGTWSRVTPGGEPDEPMGDVWRQEINLRPTGTATLFALGGPQAMRFPRRDTRISYTPADQALRYLERLRAPLDYEVISTGVVREASPEESADPYPTGGPDFSMFQRFYPGARQRLEESVIDPQIAAYAERPEVSGVDAQGPLIARRPPGQDRPHELDEAIAANIERHLRTEFAYTLDLTDTQQIGDADPMVSFLYDFRRGHCEYFAGAMALMCQHLGLEARMVVGFRCDEFNPLSDTFVVRQSHAHAWVEVLLPDGTWRTYDPTSSREAAPVAADPGAWDRATQLLDFLEHAWATKVVAFDQGNRDALWAQTGNEFTRSVVRGSNLLANLGQHVERLGYWLASHIIGPVIALMVLVLVAAVATYAYQQWRLRRRAGRIGLDALPPREQVRLARQLGFYDELIRMLERRRIVRPVHFTPMEFSRSLAFLPGDAFDVVRRLTDVYYRIRYGGTELTPARHDRLGRVVSRLDDQLVKP